MAMVALICRQDMLYWLSILTQSVPIFQSVSRLQHIENKCTRGGIRIGDPGSIMFDG